MLDVSKTLAALESRREGLVSRAQQERIDRLIQALNAMAVCSQGEINAELQGIPWPGAWPTEEQDTQPLAVPFGVRWDNHQQARRWALDILRGVRTFAADGSQIPPSRDVSLRVGLVQVGWYENRHCGDGPGMYDKDLAVEVLTADELSGDSAVEAEIEIGWRRFAAEVDAVQRFMQTAARDNAADQALAFVDGSLIISFVGQLDPDRQAAYTAKVESLLATSEATRVPVVGYVDTSYANDLATLVARLSGDDMHGGVSDAALAGTRLTNWGDRCRLFRCGRDDRVLFRHGKFYSRVLFTYLRTTSSGPPARVEIPDWVLATGRQDTVLDLIRAECVVGLGYPYTIETADSVAVLTAKDRERFLKLLQRFAEREGAHVWLSRKSRSKRARRV